MTLRIARLECADGTRGIDSGIILDGTAKAWANFNASNNSVHASFNVSSFVDVSTLVTNCNYTASMSASDQYGVSTSCNNNTAGRDYDGTSVGHCARSLNSNGMTLVTYNADPYYLSFSVYGDFA